MMIELYNGTRVLYRKSLKVCDDSYPPTSWLYPKPNYTLCVDKLFQRMLNLLLIFAHIISFFWANCIIFSRVQKKRKPETFVFSIGGRRSDESLSHNRSLQLSCHIYHHPRHNHHYCCLLYSCQCHHNHHCHHNNCSITVNHSNSLIYDVKNTIKGHR